jgi:hypothetical protein
MNLAPGDEIFLDYGDSFFKNENGDDDKEGQEVSVESMFELDQHSSDENYEL